MQVTQELATTTENRTHQASKLLRNSVDSRAASSFTSLPLIDVSALVQANQVRVEPWLRPMLL